MQTMQNTQQEILKRLRPAEKIALFHHLRQTAWQLKHAYLKKQHPDWSESVIENEVRKRFLYAQT
jgi:hypothetical protein